MKTQMCDIINIDRICRSADNVKMYKISSIIFEMEEANFDDNELTTSERQTALNKLQKFPWRCEKLKKFNALVVKNRQNLEYTQYLESTARSMFELFGLRGSATFCNTIAKTCSDFSEEEKKQLETTDNSENIIVFLKKIIGLAIKNLTVSRQEIGEQKYNEQLGLDIDNPMRINLLKEAGELGVAKAYLDLAAIYYSGNRNVQKSYKKAYSYFEKSKHRVGLWSIGWMYEKGEVTLANGEKKYAEKEKFEPSYEEAIKYYEEGCDQSKRKYFYAKSLNSIGNIWRYKSGGKDIDSPLLSCDEGKSEIEMAKKYYNRAIEAGSVHASINMGELIFNEAKIRDDDEAIELFKQSLEFFKIGAEYDNGYALNMVGEFYFCNYGNAMGQNKEENNKMAKIQFEKASKYGVKKAHFNLGKWYEKNILNGHRSKDNYESLRKNFEKALSNGIYDANYYLAAYYMDPQNENASRDTARRYIDAFEANIDMCVDKEIRYKELKDRIYQE